MANIFRAKSLISRTGTFSNEVTAPNLVYNTGNQTITGLKDFTTRPTVNTIPVLLSGESTNGLNILVKNDDSVTLLKGQPVYIYGANGNNILIRRASNTGEAFSSKTLGLLNQDLAPNAQGYVITEGALEGIDTNSANAGDPIWLGSTGDLIFGLANKPYAPNHLVYLGVVERKQANNGKIYVKVQNGFELQELHNVNIDHTYSLNNNDILRYNSASGLWFNQTLNTGIFQDQINSLSGAAVLTYGNQTILGNKTFDGNTYINNLFVTGTQTIVSTNNFSVQSPYLLLNLTGGAVDGGIFFVTGSGLTGLNDFGPIIGFDHSDKFKFGISTRNSDLSTLNTIAAVSDITNYSGFVDNKYATIVNLASTGSTLQGNLLSTGSNLQGQINSLGNTYATVTDLANTGSTLNTKVNNLSGYINSTGSNIVFATGNQTISGVKTFSSSLVTNIISGTLTTNSLNISAANDTNTGSSLNFGGSLFLNAGTGTLFGAPNYGGITINGSGPKNQGTVNINGDIRFNQTTVSTWNNNPINIYKSGTQFGNAGIYPALTIDNNNISLNTPAGGAAGFGLVISGAPVTPALYATITNLVTTGSTLNTAVNNLSGQFNITGSNLNNQIQFVSGALNNSGVNLINQINSMSGAFNLTGSNLNNRIVFVSGSLNNSGVNLINSINSLSGVLNNYATKSLAIAYAIAL